MTTLFLVIGSNSFSGSHFVRHLLEKGQKVLGVSRSEEPHKVFLPYKWLENSQEFFQFHRMDLNNDLEPMLSLIQSHKPEFIVNFAAQGMVAQSWKSPEHWYQTNVVAQVKFHNEIRKLDFIKKYVHVTTPEVYGSTDGWISESFNFSPSTPYAVSRAACDLHLKSFFDAYNFPVVFTRAANVYGPGQQLYRIIPRAILYAKLGKRLSLHGGGYSERSFIHITDVAEATYKILINGKPGETYHISTNNLISIRSLVTKVATELNIKFMDLVNETDDRLGKDQSYMLSSNKLRDELDWLDTINLDEGIDQTIDWVLRNLNLLKNQPQDYIHKS